MPHVSFVRMETLIPATLIITPTREVITVSTINYIISKWMIYFCVLSFPPLSLSDSSLHHHETQFVGIK
jgi:hypothetical protein